ncbi:MAG: PLDc N-terminal domain-containing protein [Nanoarchaeota archaeon]|nr:PLDc N-terminal domain-containing protein [Nanoarchaeota archaeon]MBU1269765.1 PLDc N-terminal domain-containing protein [Nanoarchaeota archaeon]MBU1604357.1 PLDc N-terminal domain-containing protein [Nanoarchaeota archaeon]MBU2443387.1 PLDc N-terminal domain-containing protein [Nanoarchaeota archaeon]
MFGIMGLLFTFFWLIFFAAIIGCFVFWILMIVDVAKREFPKQDDKTVWILIVALTGVIGAIIYYFVIKRKH